MLTSTDEWKLYGETFKSRLLLGTSRYPSPDILAKAVLLAQPAMLTASLRGRLPTHKTRRCFGNFCKA
jgi:thiazole synthase